jgi:hypothetical protein
MATTKKKISRSRSSKSGERSLQRSSQEVPFFTFRITQQSVYWLTLCLLILGLGIWVITLTIRVQSIYDQVDRSAAVYAEPFTKKQ